MKSPDEGKKSDNIETETHGRLRPSHPHTRCTNLIFEELVHSHGLRRMT